MTDTHTCPGKGCNRQVPYSKFACHSHWYSLPKHLQDAIWHGYRTGEDHFDAIVAAIEYLDKS